LKTETLVLKGPSAQAGAGAITISEDRSGSRPALEVWVSKARVIAAILSRFWSPTTARTELGKEKKTYDRTS
jgi:hypothetical protein